MNPIKTIVAFALVLLFTGCTESNVYTNEAQCKQSLCTKEHCYVWSAELNRCGTSEALKKEELRLKKIAKQTEQMDSVKAVLPKPVRDSIAKIEKKEKAIRSEINDLKKIVDSLRVADSLAGTNLTAAAYLKSKLNADKRALELKYKSLMDSVEVLNLVNHKPITAVQWIDYNKRKKKAKLEQLERKKEKAMQSEKTTAKK